MTAAAAVVISVFGLFRPTLIEIAPANASSSVTLMCPAGAPERLEGSHTHKLAPGCEAKGEFALIIPGKIRREFRGALRIEPGLTALVTMDLETAVASVVASELPSNTPAAALDAQAIAARSYYAANPNGRHNFNAFCDSTHCQHIRGALNPDHPAVKAALRTRGLVLDYETHIVAAMYSGACKGQRQAGVANADGYPYLATECEYCRRRPAAKLGLHYRGLCQAGATDLALHGKDAREILGHYYPGTRVRPLEQ